MDWSKAKTPVYLLIIIALTIGFFVYSYDFDRNSVVYWDRTNPDKNKAMNDNIKKLLGDQENHIPKADIVCEINAGDLKAENLYLDNPDCNIGASSSNSAWPNGRVWHVAADSDIEIIGNIRSKGTLIVDFKGASGTVRISTKSGESDSFRGDSSLGLMVINGGNVEFTKDAEKYNGIIFAPGSSSSGGTVSFAEGGASIKIRGSIVADQINFHPRTKDSRGYAVTIYTDAQILGSTLPGFENIMSVIIYQ